MLGQGLSAQGGFQVLLERQVALLGRRLPRPVVHPHPGFTDRPHEEIRPDTPGPPSLAPNWFRAKRHFSSGTVAGFNNKAKLTMRKSYGFRTYKAAEIAYIIYLTLYTNPSSPTDSAEEASFWKLRQNTLPFFIGCRVCITAPVTGIIVASVRLPGHLNLIVKRHKLHFESGFGSALNLFLEF